MFGTVEPNEKRSLHQAELLLARFLEKAELIA
jgi:hypothetical protein